MPSAMCTAGRVISSASSFIPDFQGHGFGEQLLIESLKYQLSRDAYPLTLNTQIDNLSSQALYKRYGYRVVGRPVQVMKRVMSDE